jgi:DNA-binding TFAR19-related protein (PDSD5 family)
VDGTQYEVSSLDDFGAVERARIRKFQRQLVATEKVLNTSEDDAALTRAIEEQDRVTNALMQLLVPEMSLERIANVKLMRKAAFMKWWNARQEAAASQQGNDQPGT